MCGKTAFMCKTLHWAVGRSTDRSKIYIIGDQPIDESKPILLKRRSRFVGQRGARILNRRNWKSSHFLFEVTEQSVNVDFVSLRFEGISALLNFKKGLKPFSTITIFKCHFRNISNDRVSGKSVIESPSTQGFINFVVRSSTFIDIRKQMFNVTTPTLSVMIMHCIYRRIPSFEFAIVTQLMKS